MGWQRHASIPMKIGGRSSFIEPIVRCNQPTKISEKQPTTQENLPERKSEAGAVGFAGTRCTIGCRISFIAKAP